MITTLGILNVGQWKGRNNILIELLKIDFMIDDDCLDFIFSYILRFVEVVCKNT